MLNDEMKNMIETPLERGGALPFDADSTDRLRAAIGKLSRRLRPTVAASGLTPSQVSVLFTIVRRAGGRSSRRRRALARFALPAPRSCS